MIFKNIYPRLLTNRNSFKNDNFFSCSELFTPSVLSREEANVRNDLFLSNSETDLYVVSFLTALETYTEVKKNLRRSIDTYDIFDYPIQTPKIEGAEFINSPGKGSGFNDSGNTNLPVITKFTIAYNTESTINVNGEIIPFRISEKDIYPDWHENYPLNGGFRVYGPWVSGSVIEVEYEPLHFPYSAVIKRASTINGLNKILLESGFLENYSQSLDPIEKTAIIAAALIKSHPQYNA